MHPLLERIADHRRERRKERQRFGAGLIMGYWFASAALGSAPPLWELMFGLFMWMQVEEG